MVAGGFPVPRIMKSALAFLLVLTLQGCSLFRQEFNEPDVRVLAISRLPGGSLLDQRFALQLAMTNPNDLELDIRQLAFICHVGETELVRGTSTDVPPVAPFGETRFTVQGSANLIAVAKLLRKMQKHPDQRFGYTLQADIELEHGWPSTFHLTRDGDIGFRDLLERAR